MSGVPLFHDPGSLQRRSSVRTEEATEVILHGTVSPVTAEFLLQWPVLSDLGLDA